MGLLKHAVLPLYAFVNIAMAIKILVNEDYDMLLENFPRDYKGLEGVTTLETHLLHLLGGTCLILFVNSVAAIFVENSHYRGMAVLLQVLFIAADVWSYGKMGMEPPAVLYGLGGLGVVGLAVHSMEPGIFEKDKNDWKKMQ